jgi:hypothetical protein
LESLLKFEILPQPNDTTCGPTCLQAVYRFYNDNINLTDVISEVPMLESGGTLAPILGTHALSRGYKASIYSFNLKVFDPTWFINKETNLQEKLKEQMIYKKDDLRLQLTSRAYIDFLNNGGTLKFEDLSPKLIRSYLKKSIPLLAGLSSTFLYREMRQLGENEDHDILGLPSGHFVVLCGYDPLTHMVLVADPLNTNPFSKMQSYMINIERLICAILLGILTDDANLLIIEPKEGNKK